MQLHTLHHIHDGAAAIKAACAYTCACADPPIHAHAHARTHTQKLGYRCRSRQREECLQAFTDRKELELKDNNKHENRMKEQ